MLKDTEVKKIIKTFNKYAKGLRADGLYVINGNNAISTIIDGEEVPGAFITTFYDFDLITDNIQALMGDKTLINGVGLNKALGTGLTIELNDDGTIDEIKCKECVWDYVPDAKVERTILNQYSKYLSQFSKLENKEYIIGQEMLNSIIEEKNFILNLPDIFDDMDIDILKISNKSLKNFGKDTIEIKCYLTENITFDSDSIKLVKFSVINRIYLNKDNTKWYTVITDCFHSIVVD